ncbi:MAG: hypothetical protein ACK5PP_18560 [Acidimicrobiales bacterium]
MDPLTFGYSVITTNGSAATHAEAIGEHLSSLLDRGQVYGLFTPLFGLASDQLVVMTSWPDASGANATAVAALESAPEVVEVAHRVVESTARPTGDDPPIRPGVYVHRTFDLRPSRLDQAVKLSVDAWGSFEQAFEARVVGLFRTCDLPEEEAELTLLNWYPDLAAWEASRDPDGAPDAATRFAERRELTDRTRAICTRLIIPAS